MASDEYACPKCYAVARKADSLGPFMMGEFNEMAGKGYYSGKEMEEKIVGLVPGLSA